MGAELLTSLTLRLSSPATACQILSYVTSGRTSCFVIITWSLPAGVAPGRPVSFASSAENPPSPPQLQFSSFFFFSPFIHFSFHIVREEETFPLVWMEIFIRAFESFRLLSELGSAVWGEPCQAAGRGGCRAHTGRVVRGATSRFLFMLLARTEWKGLRWLLNPLG